MDRGFIRVYRKIQDNPVLHERGKRFSRYEAFLWLCLNARGTDDPKTGLKRGEIEASVRFLAGVWNWGQGSVVRFQADLMANSMLKRVERSPERRPERYAERFSICNYELYNPTRNANRNAERNAERNNNKEGLNTGEKQDKGKDTQPAVAGDDASPQSLLDIFQKHNKKLPGVKAFTDDRVKKCKARIDQARRDGCLSQYLEDFSAAVKKAQLTPFLCGESGDRGWRANFDWFVENQRNVYSVLEGKYDNGNGGKPHAATLFDHPTGAPGSTSDARTSRGEHHYIPKQR